MILLIRYPASIKSHNLLRLLSEYGTMNSKIWSPRILDGQSLRYVHNLKKFAAKLTTTMTL